MQDRYVDPHPVAQQSTGPRFEPGTNLEVGRYANTSLPCICTSITTPNRYVHTPLSCMFFMLCQRLFCWVMLLCETNISMRKLMLSRGTKCYHVGPNAIMWSGTKCYHARPNVIMGTRFYHVEQMLSEGQKNLLNMWYHMLSFGSFLYNMVNLCWKAPKKKM